MVILLEDVGKSYELDGKRLVVLDGVSAQIGQGEFVSLIGPSGCGKSTLFNIICGLAEPDRGKVLFNGREGVGAGEVVSYMPQKDLLLPWRSLLDNVILAREVDGVSRKEARREARELMSLFGLAGFENSYPSELSGGMRQRAALMRTVLARRPVLLLDEPFGALDAITRTRMQLWLLEIWANFRQAIFFVTHDIDEALLLSGRVYVLTPRPARVALHLKVDLPGPRSAEIITTPRFLELKKTIMEALLK
ncbi:ABC-type nitrate/sulfonate/bicarbonate transport system, ATPase component [Desulfotomaculum arcticum]|uniref:ABC-type nitrate/sulfonate/bicarbonate transport system, ATPase component n=1 Tax=Desulfotruncus arcticus DSM 17038 TaxID=1121424 RepID=A0A1I2QFF3_9FIRM|nr:ABC transporter ATP-binding protein [Desulfotruncus arcticus]SFG24977.1 ABC-type nitrate/sulfonate/bicarbonate transport system, ATPase component [Desulfotomaculum arcticum] [Desulfotruncus arcticus DSM 17038]